MSDASWNEILNYNVTKLFKYPCFVSPQIIGTLNSMQLLQKKTATPQFRQKHNSRIINNHIN